MAESVIGVIGAGRFGRAICDLATDEGRVELVYDSRKPDDWYGERVPDVIIDCSAPAMSDWVADLCRNLNLPLVECVSGLQAEQLERFTELGRETTVVLATNLSVGNYLQTRALRYIADVVTAMDRAGIRGVVPEVAGLERHPVTKAHRPSATALLLAREWRDLSGGAVSDVASLRAGPAVSDHEIGLIWPDQTLILSHEVRSLHAAAATTLNAVLQQTGAAAGTACVAVMLQRFVSANGTVNGFDEAFWLTLAFVAASVVPALLLPAGAAVTTTVPASGTGGTAGHGDDTPVPVNDSGKQG